MEWMLQGRVSEGRNDKMRIGPTYEINHAPLLLPRALPRTSRPALSTSLFFIRQKRNGNVLGRFLGFRLRMAIIVTNRMWVIAWTCDGLRRR